MREDNGRGWVPVFVFTGASCERGDGDGSPHPRGQREEDGFPPPSSRGQAGGWGWVPASARTTGGDGFPFASSRGQAVSGGTGMGPRIREDNGRGWVPVCVFTGAGCERGGRGWVPASARTTGGDGFPSASSRGQAVSGGTGMGPRIREDNGRGVGCSWFSSSRGQAVSGGKGMGPRIREDNGRGRVPGVFTGASCERGGRGWVPASARTTGGDGFPWNSSSRGQAERGDFKGDGDGSPHREDNGRGTCLCRGE